MRTNKKRMHRLLVELDEMREKRGYTQGQMSSRLGYAKECGFRKFLFGKNSGLEKLTRWADYLGYEIVMRPKLTESEYWSG